MTDQTTVLRLMRCRFDDPGHGYGLRAGDVLIAVDGETWTGSAQDAARRISQAGKPVALTFRRGSALFSILTSRMDLGKWERIAHPIEHAPQVNPAAVLRNWEIIARPDGLHDLFPLAPSNLALVLPAFWLAQNRLWTWLATFGAALAFASPLGLAAVAVIWVLGGLYFRTSGPSLLRADRVMEGFHRRGIIAARSETEARAIWLALSPDSKFRFHTPEGPMQPAEA